MLTAKCNNVDEFKKNGYDVVKKEFDSWCDNSKSIFAKIDDKKSILVKLSDLLGYKTRSK